MRNWIIEYDNSDTSSTQWWTVTDGDRHFTTYQEGHAKWLCNLLNGIEKWAEDTPLKP